LAQATALTSQLDGFSIKKNSTEKFCTEWVLSASAGGTGSFSAPAVTHSTSESAHEVQTFQSNSFH
jgi:hypothetical protein